MMEEARLSHEALDAALLGSAHESGGPRARPRAVLDYEEAPPPPLDYRTVMRGLSRYCRASWRDIPLYKFFRRYSLAFLLRDAIAGISVSVLLIPQSMAYAQLAGLPAIYGLYSAGVPLLVYALAASSTVLAVGPVGPTSILLNQLVTQLSPGSEAERIQLSIALSFACGVILLFGALLRLGIVANLLSRPVTSGFMSAAAFLIVSSQLKELFGLPPPPSNFFPVEVFHALISLPDANWRTTLLGLSCLLVLASFKHLHRLYLWPCSRNKSPPPRWVPIQLIVVIVCILISFGAKLPDVGVNVVGSVPEGFPTPVFPVKSFSEFGALLPAGGLQALVGYVGTISLGVAFAKQSGTSVSPTIEMAAQGLSSLVGSFFLSMPPAGSFTRTAMNAEMNAATPLAGFLTGLVMIVVLVAAARLFEFLPECTLAAMVIASTQSLVKVQDFLLAWRTSGPDVVEFIVTFLLTLFLGVGNGIIVAVALSVVRMLVRAMRPTLSQLGRLPASEVFVDLDRYPDAATEPHSMILRIDGELNFANAASIYARCMRLCEAVLHRRGLGSKNPALQEESSADFVLRRHAPKDQDVFYDETDDDDETDDEEINNHHNHHHHETDLVDHDTSAQEQPSAFPASSLHPDDAAHLPRPPVRSKWRQDPLHIDALILDMSRVTSIDLSACEVLEELAKSYADASILLRFASISVRVKDTLRRFIHARTKANSPCVLDLSSYSFMTISDALQSV